MTILFTRPLALTASALRRANLADIIQVMFTCNRCKQLKVAGTMRAVQKWVAAGLLPAVVASSGKRAVYLVRLQDLKGFERPTQGRPSKRN